MNDRVKITDTKILSDNWYVLKKVNYEYRQKDGSWLTYTGKHTIVAMVQQYCSIIALKKQ